MVWVGGEVCKTKERRTTTVTSVYAMLSCTITRTDYRIYLYVLFSAEITLAEARTSAAANRCSSHPR